MHGDQIQHALRCEDTCCEQRRVARARYSDCRYGHEGKECDVCSRQRFSFDSPKFRHRQPVAQPTGTAGIMTSGRGVGLLGVNTCHRCIEHLVFGLFECGVGELDCSSRIGLGSLGPCLRPVCLQICLGLVCILAELGNVGLPVVLNLAPPLSGFVLGIFGRRLQIVGCLLGSRLGGINPLLQRCFILGLRRVRVGFGRTPLTGGRRYC
jgi:hypothetical protein